LWLIPYKRMKSRDIEAAVGAFQVEEMN
jgi:hypothetical protein